MQRFRAVVMGVSAGGMEALSKLLPMFPADFPAPIIIVQHLHPTQGNYFIEYYNNICKLKVKKAENGEGIRQGFIYFAPANNHLIINPDKKFMLNKDKKVNYARPSIDLLFESAAEEFGFMLIGVILTGANYDGAFGAKMIKKNCGIVFVQDPSDAEVPSMPEAAINNTKVDFVLPLLEIGHKINELINTSLTVYHGKKKKSITNIR